MVTVSILHSSFANQSCLPRENLTKNTTQSFLGRCHGRFPTHDVDLTTKTLHGRVTEIHKSLTSGQAFHNYVYQAYGMYGTQLQGTFSSPRLIGNVYLKKTQ